MIRLILLLLVFVLLWGIYSAGKNLDRRSAFISSRDLAGIWRQATADTLVGYLYFTEDGSVYYMASKLPVTEAMFTDKFKLSDSCAGQTFSLWGYTVRREADGQLLLEVSGKAINGAYHKVN